MAADGDPSFETVIVGGGIAGAALATVLARAGREVLVLERASVYRDRVRGEFLQPWGVAEAARLGLPEVLEQAGGNYHTRFVPYDETLEPAEAEAAGGALDAVLPGVGGTLGIAHPVACQALANAAVRADAEVRWGIADLRIEPGSSPLVRYRWQDAEHVVRCRLVVGADGRDSVVRNRAGIPLHSIEPRLLGAGLLVEGLRVWPEHQVSMGTEDDRVFFILPQRGGRARLYLMYPADQRTRYTGTDAGRKFLIDFALQCVPGSEDFSNAVPAGPCAAYAMHDTWTDSPYTDGVVLIGDAAGYSDPHAGQGLSVAFRDVRVVSDLMLSGDGWSTSTFAPYGEERSERMRRLRMGSLLVGKFRGDFGEEARERRRVARVRMQREPELALWRRAALAGPDSVPASAFDESVAERLFAPAIVSGR